MVEFALLLIPLLILLGGIIDFGWVFSNKVIANNASREAARFAAMNYYKVDQIIDGTTYTYDLFVEDVKEEAEERIPDSITPTITVDPTKVVNGDKSIEVKVQWNTEVFMFVYSNVLNPFPIESKTIMKTERSIP